MSRLSKPPDKGRLVGNVLVIVLVIAGIGGVGLVMSGANPGTGHHSGTANAQSPPKQEYVYSAKFVCGIVQDSSPNDLTAASEPPVKPGNYATAINIHNFRSAGVNLSVHEAVAMAVVDGSEVNRQVSAERFVTVSSGTAVEIDCSEILAVFDGSAVEGARFVKGFVQIQSPEQIEVAAVYTSQPIEVDQTASDVPIHVNLSTGFDQNAFQPITRGAPDDDYFITDDPNLSTPRDAIVINESTRNQYFPDRVGIRWISTDEGARRNVTPGETFEYTRSFTLPAGAGSNLQLAIEILADDEAEVYLNNHHIGSASTKTAPPTSISTTSGFNVGGTNELRIVVTNTGGDVTGLNVNGQITGTVTVTNTSVTAIPGTSMDVEYIDPYIVTVQSGKSGEGKSGQGS